MVLGAGFSISELKVLKGLKAEGGRRTAYFGVAGHTRAFTQLTAWTYTKVVASNT